VSDTRWTRVCTSILNGPVVAAALDSLGITPKLTTSGPGTYDIWVDRDVAGDAVRFLGRAPGAGWPSVDPKTVGSLIGMYFTSTLPDGSPA
jgi:hypothetical protein